MNWSFLVDEKQSPRLAQHLRIHGFDAEHVTDVLDQGAKDVPDVLPYANQHDHVIVSNDGDWIELDVQRHSGVPYLERDVDAEPHDLAFAVLDGVDQYPSRQQFYFDYLDDYL